MLKSSYPAQRDNSCWRSKRLISELKFLQTEPPAGVEARALDGERSTWLASLTGPPGSPYEGGKFYILIQVPDNYPMTPPIMRFLTKIFHPNVNRHGDIGLDVLLNNWSLALTMGKLLLSIQSLLTDPNPEICMESKVGRLYKENRMIFDLMAQAWTWKFAMIDFFM